MMKPNNVFGKVKQVANTIRELTIGNKRAVRFGIQVFDEVPVVVMMRPRPPVLMLLDRIRKRPNAIGFNPIQFDRLFGSRKDVQRMAEKHLGISGTVDVDMTEFHTVRRECQFVAAGQHLQQDHKLGAMYRMPKRITMKVFEEA